jgi:hypothetical protein
MMGDVMSQTQDDAPPAGRLSAPPLPRLAAVAVDGATYLIIPALLVPIGLLLSRRGVTLSSLAVKSVVPGWLWMLTAVTYGWLLLNLILLIIPSHRPVHDRLARTDVRDQKMVVTP